MAELRPEIITVGKRNVTFPVEGREDCQGYLTEVQKDAKIGLVLIQEWWGLNQSLVVTADTVAQQGFNVLVPDVYRGKQAKSREEAGHYFSDLNWTGAVEDMKAAALYLRNVVGCSKVAIAGFCLGGALTLAALSATDVFDAGAPFYGVPNFELFPLKNITVPVQAHFGELDASVGFSDIETAKKLEAAAHEQKLDFQLVQAKQYKAKEQHEQKQKEIVWPQGLHAFMNQHSANYNAEIAAKALTEVASFLQKRLL